MTPTRRDALRGLAATTLLPLAPGCGPDDTPDTPRAPFGWETLRKRVRHVVVVCMENRSFDHYLGALALEGRGDVDGLTPDMSNPTHGGDEVRVHPADEVCGFDAPHSWTAGHAQFADGRNDGFVREMEDDDPDLAHVVMGYWDRAGQPVTYALADAHVVCDAWHCALLSSTWPNRFYLWAGQNGGERGNDRPSVPLPAVFGSMADRGRTCREYYQNLPFNVLMPDTRGLEFHAWERFLADAEQGTLADLSIVEPIYGRNDDHPPNHPLAGQIFLAEVYDALSRSPAWNDTLLLITYDEHGGFFDHVPPPTTTDERAADGFGQCGFRVPTLVCGPWVRRGEVSHVVYDHTSLLAFLANLFELEPLTARSAAADPMLDVFDVDAVETGVPHPPTTLPVIVADDEVLYAPECLYDPIFLTERSITMQPELDAFADAHLRGSPLDRRRETFALYAQALARAEQRGLLVRR